jgi:hypothetical protein
MLGQKQTENAIQPLCVTNGKGLRAQDRFRTGARFTASWLRFSNPKRSSETRIPRQEPIQVHLSAVSPEAYAVPVQ